MTYQQQIADATTTQLLATTDAVLLSGLSFCSLSAATTMDADAEAVLVFSTTIPIVDVITPGFGLSSFFSSAVATTIPAANY